MYLRIVFGSRPVRRAIALIDKREVQHHDEIFKLDHLRRPRINSGDRIGRG